MKQKQSEQTKVEVDMNPMLDVVFILLIFFIVTTTFVNAKAIAVDRPKAKENNNIVAKNIMIKINQDNSIWLDNRIIDPERIAVNIARISANFEIKSILVNANSHSTHQTLMTVMSQVKLMGDFPIAITSKII